MLRGMAGVAETRPTTASTLIGLITRTDVLRTAQALRRPGRPPPPPTNQCRSRRRWRRRPPEADEHVASEEPRVDERLRRARRLLHHVEVGRVERERRRGVRPPVTRLTHSSCSRHQRLGHAERRREEDAARDLADVGRDQVADEGLGSVEDGAPLPTAASIVEKLSSARTMFCSPSRGDGGVRVHRGVGLVRRSPAWAPS